MDNGAMAQDTNTGESSTGSGPPLDAQAAAAILAEAGQHARDELRIKRPVIFASAGLAWLIGYGAIWLSVRGQHPYQGPAPEAVTILVVLLAVAVTITASVTSRAASGVGGLSAQRRRIGAAALIAGYIGSLTLEAALYHGGASRAVAFGLYAAAAPVVITGVAYIAGSALRTDWYLFGLGLWLIAVAAGGAFAGPVGVWGVTALAGAPGYVLAAVLQRRLSAA